MLLRARRQLKIDGVAYAAGDTIPPLPYPEIERLIALGAAEVVPDKPASLAADSAGEVAAARRTPKRKG